MVSDGSYVDRWTIAGEAGDVVTVTMRSTELDAYLIAAEAVGSSFDFLAQDDDSGGGSDAEIRLELPHTGTFVILANSYAARETGAYSLEVSIGRPDAIDWEARFPGGGDPNDRYALLIGIDDYPGTGSDLRGPVDDANLIRDALIDRYDFPEENIVLLTDEEATREGIANAFVRHLGQAGPDGVAVFYYSGHGTQIGQNIGLTQPLDPEPDGTDEGLYVWGLTNESSIILDEELGYLAEQLPSNRTLLIVDACFSGTMSRASDVMAKFVSPDLLDVPIVLPRRFISDELDPERFAFGADPDAVTSILSQPQRHILMAASTEAQLSYALAAWPDREGPASLYTDYLARRLTSAADGDSFGDVHRLTAEDVRAHYTADPGIDPQDPQILGRGIDRVVGSFLGGG